MQIEITNQVRYGTHAGVAGWWIFGGSTAPLGKVEVPEELQPKMPDDAVDLAAQKAWVQKRIEETVTGALVVKARRRPGTALDVVWDDVLRPGDVIAWERTGTFNGRVLRNYKQIGKLTDCDGETYNQRMASMTKRLAANCVLGETTAYDFQVKLKEAA